MGRGFFSLLSAVPPAILATFDDDPEPAEDDDQCLFILALKRANFLPLWKEVCPLEQHEKKWGPDWERLRVQICCLGDETSGNRNVLALKWEADALSTSAQFGRANAWEKCLDEDINHLLAEQNSTIRDLWAHTDNNPTDNGQENNDLNRNFSQHKLSHSLRSLESYIGNLEWTFLTDVDITMLSELVLDKVMQAVLYAHWEKLSVDSKRHEQCTRTIGWLAHMVAIKSSTEVRIYSANRMVLLSKEMAKI
ncbi:hypothetical protein B0H13DRAFT_1857421 [Mycena leptocephala]|nr:hypothetical protein B0H13DRAFT_1857421 [Mycena leptocephala]